MINSLLKTYNKIAFIRF